MDPKRTPIEPGFIERLSAGVRFAFTGDAKLYEGWFGPGVPLAPVADASAVGRQYDYPVSVNTQQTPRSTEHVNFATLRGLADGYDLLRLVIETKKDQLVKIKWTVKPKGEDAESDARCEEVMAFLESPDKVNSWAQWFRAGMEDLLVVDAWTILPRRTKGGKPWSLEIIDGATIRPILGLDGRRPAEGPIYQQILKGVVAAEYVLGEIYYLPQNVRSFKPYGFSRVEQVLTSVNIAINRQLHQLSYYTKGSTPDLLLSCPPEWNMDQVRKFADWWDSQLSGNSGNRRKGIVVPAGISSLDTKAGALKDDYDEWLARIICYTFSVAPQGLIKEQNRSVAETQNMMAKEEGIVPILDFVSDVLTRVICGDLFGYSDLKIIPEDEQSVDALVQAQIDSMDILSGVRTIDECRAGRGLEAMPEIVEPVAVTTTPPSGGGTLPNVIGGDTNAPVAVQPPEATKLAKAKKIKPIKRERPNVLRVQKQIHKAVSKFLRSTAGKVVSQVVSQKMSKVSMDEIKAILDEAGIDWTELGDDLEPLLLAIAEDGALEALLQIGAPVHDLLAQVNEVAVKWASEHAAELVTGLEQTTMESLRSVVTSAIEQGLSTGDLADQIQAAYGFSDARAEMIARTERGFADQQGNLIAYKESGLVVGKRSILGSEHDGLDSSPDECDDAADMGIIGLDDDFGGLGDPPYHPNCFLPGTIVSAAGVSKHFKRWFEGEILRLVIEGNDDLSVTPNHPILTMRGWVNASEIQEGDDLINAIDPGMTVVLMNPDNNHIETTIEDIAYPLLMTLGVSSCAVPTTSEDFHGDGTPGQNVHIIDSNCELRDDGNPMFGKFNQHNPFIPALNADSLASGCGNSMAVVDTLSLPSHGVVGGIGSPFSFNRANSGSLDQVRITHRSDGQSVDSECSTDCGAMTADILREIDARLPSLISSVKVQKVIRGEKFAGHVFNLQTDSGWYFANSIIAHNCVCAVEPILEGEPE